MDSDTAYWFEQLSSAIQANTEMLIRVESQLEELKELLVPEPADPRYAKTKDDP